jgi:hypothetical protein
MVFPSTSQRTDDSGSMWNCFLILEGIDTCPRTVTRVFILQYPYYKKKKQNNNEKIIIVNRNCQCFSEMPLILAEPGESARPDMTVDRTSDSVYK